jgi:hypothetical protein
MASFSFCSKTFSLDVPIYVHKFRNIVFRLFHELPLLLFPPLICCLAALTLISHVSMSWYKIWQYHLLVFTENVWNLRFKYPSGQDLLHQNCRKRHGNGDWSQNPNQPVRSIDMPVLGWVVLLCTKEFFIKKSFSKKWQSDFFHTLQAAKVTIQNLDNLQSKFKGKSTYFLVILCKRFNCWLWNTKLI